MAGVCGRDCESCQDRCQQGCRGCVESQGNPYWGKCGVALCGHGRGLSACADCRDAQECHRVEGTEEEKAGFARRQEEERQQAEERLAERRRTAPLLAKWLRVLFWITIVGGSISLVMNFLGDQALAFQIVMGVVDLAIMVVNMVAFWKLSKVSHRFRTVWRCQLAALGLLAVAVAFAAYVMLVWLPKVNEGEIDTFYAINSLLGGSAVLLLVCIAFVMVVLHHYCEAVAEQLDGVDDKSAKSWRLLRTWQLWALGALGGGLLLSFGAAGLGLVVTLIVFMVVLVGAIVQLVLLWKAGSQFQALSAESALE